MITEAIYKAISGEDLEYDTARAAMEEIWRERQARRKSPRFSRH